MQIFSCKEFEKQNLSTKINESIKKIEEVVEKKNHNNLTNQKKNNNNLIFYHIGETYYIEGVKYTPEENYNYSDIGIATYYGKELHNKKTINNDINKVTELLGRHKILPIPSMVKITNLDNGLSLNIKIVDRHDDNTSLIQVSRKVAQLLGFYKDKIATVKVEILSDSSKQWKNVLMSVNEAQFNETISSAPTETVSITNIDNSSVSENSFELNREEPIEILSNDVELFDLYLIVYDIKDQEKIIKIVNSYSMSISYTLEKNNLKYNLMLGPLDKVEINKLVSYFISKGYKDTKLIVK